MYLVVFFFEIIKNFLNLESDFRRKKMNVNQRPCFRKLQPKNNLPSKNKIGKEKSWEAALAVFLSVGIIFIILARAVTFVLTFCQKKDICQ